MHSCQGVATCSAQYSAGLAYNYSTYDSIEVERYKCTVEVQQVARNTAARSGIGFVDSKIDRVKDFGG